MVQLTRPTQDHRSVASRDMTVASVWRDLNRMGLRVGAVAGALTAIAYLGLYFGTGDSSFLLSSAIALPMMMSAIAGIVTKAEDIELVLLATAFGIIASTPLATPTVRGGLWAVFPVIITIGAFLLPDRKQPRFVIVMALLLSGQLLWPVFGFGTLIEAADSLVISTAATAAGFVVVRYAKRALDHSEKTRLAIFRSVPVGLFRCGRDGTIVDSNPALAEMLRFESPTDLIGRQIADLHVDPDDWAALATTLEDSGDPQRFAHRMLPDSGDPLWVRGFAQAVRDDSGHVAYHEGAIEDVTQRREVEEEARRNADRFRNVFERTPIAIWEEDYSAVGTRLSELRAQGVTDLRAYLVERPAEVRELVRLVQFNNVNPAGIKLLGASSKEQALQSLDADLLNDEVAEGFVEEFIAIWESRDTITIEVKGATVDGASTDLALSWAVGRTDDGDLDLSSVIVGIQDIAIIKQAERDLAALVESKDALVASVSHELRTPITTILGMAFELRDNRALFTEDEVTDLVSIIADQSRELSNIVEDLLVAARTDTDTLTVRPEVVNLATELSRILPDDPDGPVVEIQGPVLAWADPLRFRQILRNLLTNATRYGGPHVIISAEVTDSMVTINVSDDGAGVPVEDQGQIFEPYFRSGNDSALPGSLGLGLPVSRRLARLMGGDLTYEYDGRSVFELTLPAPVRGHFL